MLGEKYAPRRPKEGGRFSISINKKSNSNGIDGRTAERRTNYCVGD
jgi:hypothetical protein